MTERKLLIVSPHFPPTDAVDMHRVRMNLHYYFRNGFQPSVLAVNPSQAGFLTDERLVETIPDDTPVTRVEAMPQRVADLLGITDVSIRAMGVLARAGDEIIARERTDLVFFSTTRFHTMRLGVRWKRRFGVPFVLDLQDPWFTAPPSSVPLRRRGAKHALMRALHRRAEAATVPHASGLIAVSEAYIEALRNAYPALRHVHAETIPFGFSRTDFSIAQRLGDAWRPDGAADAPFGLYPGRIGDDMTSTLRTLFSAMTMAGEQHVGPMSDMRAAFLGSGYQRENNPERVMLVANEFDLRDRVIERPDRIPLLDSLSTIDASDFLILIGSEDLSYQPSKLYQLMATRKPILCIAPRESRLAAQMRDLKSVILLESDPPLVAEAVQTAAERLSGLLAADGQDSLFNERDGLCVANEAAALAARECALFDLAIAQHAATFKV